MRRGEKVLIFDWHRQDLHNDKRREITKGKDIYKVTKKKQIKVYFKKNKTNKNKNKKGEPITPPLIPIPMPGISTPSPSSQA